MRWQRCVGCLVGAALLAAFPGSTQAAGFHNGGGGAPGGAGGGGGRGFGGGAFHGGMAAGHMGPGFMAPGHMGPAHMGPGSMASGHVGPGSMVPGNWNHGNWNHGNWNHGNWTQGNWNHGDWHHRGHFRHDDHDRFIFVSGFGFNDWGYPGWWGWDYPYYYPYYSPYYYPYGDPYTYYGDNGYYGISGSPTYSYRTSAGGMDTAVQLALSRRGYYRGPIDGVIGPASEAAIRSFQAANRLTVTGTVNRSLLQALRVRAPS